MTGFPTVDHVVLCQMKIDDEDRRSILKQEGMIWENGQRTFNTKHQCIMMLKFDEHRRRGH